MAIAEDWPHFSRRYIGVPKTHTKLFLSRLRLYSNLPANSQLALTRPDLSLSPQHQLISLPLSFLISFTLLEDFSGSFAQLRTLGPSSRGYPISLHVHEFQVLLSLGKEKGGGGGWGTGCWLCCWLCLLHPLVVDVDVSSLLSESLLSSSSLMLLMSFAIPITWPRIFVGLREIRPG